MDALGGWTTYAYSPSGDLVSATDANGHTTERQYDLLGRIVASIDPLGNKEQFGYDLNGNLTKHTNALGQVTAYDYGPRDELIRTGYSDGTQVTWDYDARGRMTRMASPAAEERYTLDPVGRVLKVVNTMPSRRAGTDSAAPDSDDAPSTDAAGTPVDARLYLRPGRPPDRGDQPWGRRGSVFLPLRAGRRQ